MYESLSQRLANAFKSFKNKGKLTEADIKELRKFIYLCIFVRETYRHGKRPEGQIITSYKI